MNAKSPLLTRLRAGLTLEEQARYQNFVEELSVPNADTHALQTHFMEWATPIVTRLDLGHPGALWGQLKAQAKPARVLANAVTLDALPTPLVRAVLAWQNEDAKLRPFKAVHRLIDAIEVFCKLYTVAGVSRFVEVLGQRLDSEHLPTPEQVEQLDGIRTMLAAGLRTPSLGIWWGFARETAKALDVLGEAHVLPGGIEALTRPQSKLKKAFEGNDNLISFRNSYAHGATPSDAASQKDLDKQAPRLEVLLKEASELSLAPLIAVCENGDVLNACGAGLTPMSDPPAGLQPGRCYLVDETGHALDLHPLLVFDGKGPEGVFYFYNDLRTNHASLLNYPQALHRRDKPLRDVLLQRFPIDEWQKLGGAELDPFRERIEALTEVFKGRLPELQALATFLDETDRGFHVVWGPPGVGKSTLLARMTQLLRWDPKLREQASPGIEWPELRIEVMEYFIRRGSTDTAAKLLESLNQRLDSRFNLSIGRGTTDEERRRYFVERLQIISKRLEDDQRLVLVLDGLDEARKDDPIMSSLPRDVPPKVVVLYGSRPQQALRYGFYDELDRERRSCVDLSGLSLADTRALLYAHVDKYALETEYVEAVLERSEGNPLYLKLLCQGLEQGIYALNDRARLPSGMEELYTNALVRIEQEAPGATDLLTLLAAARDFVSPAMAAELMKLSEARLVSGVLSACMEFLYENPLTESIDDYQLFHESLREHLRNKHGSDVIGWEEALAEWASVWLTPDGDPCHAEERLLYAVSYAVPHQADCRKRALEHERHNEAQRRGETMLSLVEAERWRALCFKICGNGTALQLAIRLAQDVVRALDQNGSERERMLRFARWRHDEPYRLYNVQRDQLRTPVEGAAQKAHLEDVVQLARMGTRPRDRVMLALTALWAPQQRPQELPLALRKEMARWLEDAREPALVKLWGLSGGGQ